MTWGDTHLVLVDTIILKRNLSTCLQGHSDIVQPETNLLKRDHIENSHPVYRKLEDVNDPCSDLSDTVAAYHPNKKGIGKTLISVLK